VIIVDTGPIVAAASRNDKDHVECAAALKRYHRERPLITPLVVTEVCYFLQTRAGAVAEATFLRSVGKGTFELVKLTASDLLRCADLVERYRNFPLGAADASVIAVAERLNVRTVMTLDHRHFAAVRPAHIMYFELLP
jgi:uncharacterized protein